MNRSSLWQWTGFAVTSFSGTLLHFLYEWLDEAKWIAPFSGVNESTWEHMKLLFWPMFLFALIQYFFFRERDDYWCVKLRSILFGISLIPLIFYTYNGVIGQSADWINISIFFICAAAAYIYERKAFLNNSLICKNPKVSLAALCAVALLFIIFTFKTPPLNIFRDPLTDSFGI